MITTFWQYLLRRGLKTLSPAEEGDVILVTEDDSPIADDGGHVLYSDPEE